MHIPDGFLDAKTAIAAAAVGAAALGVALRQTRLHLPRHRVPLMGVAAAFVFAAQMINFPVAAGTSGHLIGGVLVGSLLGPGPALIVLSSVLIVQCLLFADGGILALGANIMNMALVAGVGGYGIYWLVSRLFGGLRGKLLAAAFASWCSVVLAAVACAGELALSGTVNWSMALPAMTGVHMLIGIGEALITALVLAAIARSRPELLQTERNTAPRYGEVAVYGLLVALAVALFASPLASAWPDGLDRVSQSIGFAVKEAPQPVIPPVAADYRMPGIGSATLATSIAGAVGTVVAFVLALFLARVLARDGIATPGPAASAPQ